MNHQKFYFIGFNPLKVFQSHPNVWMILFPNFRQRMSMPKGNVQKSSLGCKDRYFCMRTPSRGLFGGVTLARMSSLPKNWNFGFAWSLGSALQFWSGLGFDPYFVTKSHRLFIYFHSGTWYFNAYYMVYTPHCTNNVFNCPFLIKFTFRNISTKRKKQLLYQLIIDHFLLIEHVSNTSVQSNHIVDGAKIYRTLMTSIFTN